MRASAMDYRDLRIPAKEVRDLGLREAKDFPIFEAACEANAIVLRKDELRRIKCYRR